MASKLPHMTSSSKRSVGRPRKFRGAYVTRAVIIPMDLSDAIDRHNENRNLGGPADAMRDLLREAAEARGLVKPR